MTASIVLDASVLIAAMSPSDAHHEAAVTVLRHGAAKGLLTAHRMTIAESAVGAARHGRGELLRCSYDRLAIAVLAGDEDEPWRLSRLRAHTRLPLPDCCVLDLALETHSDIATFDSRLGAAASDAGVRIARVGG